MALQSLIKVNVENSRSLSKLGVVTVYMTPGVKVALDSETTKSGENLFKLFERGMAMRGFKHLVEKIREKKPNCKIIFTDGNTELNQDEVRINYGDYKKSAGSNFFAFYRETGLNSAGDYLGLHFPEVFQNEGQKVSETNIKHVDGNLAQVLDKLNKKKKNQKVTIDQTSKLITELAAKKSLLKQEVDSLEELRNKSNIFFFQKKIQELETRLTKRYSETTGKDSWQRWVYTNNWLFGINYQSPIEKQKISIAGNMPDYLFPTMDGFLDVLEIKLPSKDIIVRDPNHAGSYTWSGETNKAIGQVVTYLSDIELYQLHLREQIKRVYGLDIYLIKPRAFILIGNKEGWTEEQHQALRKLNYSLHGIEVLSYTDLLQIGKELVENYTKKYGD